MASFEAKNNAACERLYTNILAVQSPSAHTYREISVSLTRRTEVSPTPRPSASARSRTAANLIYNALRDDIIAMRMTPGEPINEKSVALKHGVSRTPVREALLRLSGEHLVEIFPQSGTFVTRIPIAALPETILVRKALEELTAREAAKN